MSFCPLEIDILIHYYTTPTEYREGDDFPIRGETMQRLIELGLLTQRDKPSKYGATLEATEKCAALIEAWCNTPLPVQVWVIPEQRKFNDGAAHLLSRE